MSTINAPSTCLRVQGTDIVDGDGNRVILKGVRKPIHKRTYMNARAEIFEVRYWRSNEHGELHYW